MRKIAPAMLMPLLVLLSNCRGADSRQLTVEIINQDDYIHTQAVEIRVCAPFEIEPSILRVNIYVTPRKEWNELDGVQPYTHYFDEGFISIPGTISMPLPADLWQASAEGCYAALLADAFKDTHDWIEHRMCPFRAIVVAANYGTGAWNGEETLECEVPGR